jgi:hypothetical protein
LTSAIRFFVWLFLPPSLDRLLLPEWPSAAMARGFWYSEEYGAVHRQREGTGEVHVLLAEPLSPAR